jgi:hypothetical protein
LNHFHNPVDATKFASSRPSTVGADPLVEIEAALAESANAAVAAAKAVISLVFFMCIFSYYFLGGSAMIFADLLLHTHEQMIESVTTCRREHTLTE